MGVPPFGTHFFLYHHIIILFFLINEWSPTLDYKGIFLPLNFLSDISVSFGLIVFGFVFGFFFNFGGCVCVLGFFFRELKPLGWLILGIDKNINKSTSIMTCFVSYYVLLHKAGFIISYFIIWPNSSLYNKMQFKI